MKYFIYTIIVIVVAAIIAGFFIVGSPADQRARRLDEERISNLQSIQSQIITYWVSKEALPDTLDELNNPLLGFSVPMDPSGSSYEYEKRGELEFSLCANFETISRVESAPEIPYRIGGLRSENVWKHGVGHTCFERTIDPDFFKKPE